MSRERHVGELIQKKKRSPRSSSIVKTITRPPRSRCQRRFTMRC